LDILLHKKHKKTKLKLLQTQHLLIKMKVNGVWGNFILDTGASATCIGNHLVEKFSLQTQNALVQVSSANSNIDETQISYNNIIQISSKKYQKFTLMVMDMQHINDTFQMHKIKPVDGILGADVLLHSKAIIDYENLILFVT
jgi:predicted aspartyl protease